MTSPVFFLIYLKYKPDLLNFKSKFLEITSQSFFVKYTACFFHNHNIGVVSGHHVDQCHTFTVSVTLTEVNLTNFDLSRSKIYNMATVK